MVENAEKEALQDILLARQPIFTREMTLYGYELLYRQNTSPDKASFPCGDAATSELILNNYTSVTQCSEHQRVPAFINITHNLFTSEHILPIPSQNVVLELLENITPGPDIIEAIGRYKKAGFKIALDDYPFTPEFEPLLAYADYIKVDVLEFNVRDIKEKLEHLRRFNALLLAEKVENDECYQECLQLGFHLFQGYFFEKPQIIRGKQLGQNKQAVLGLITKLYDENVNTDELTSMISQDAQLCYKLLRIINSAAYGLSRKIHSIKEAIVFLGLNHLKRWITMIALSDSAHSAPELIRTLLVRARMCELLAEKEGHRMDHDQYFTAGLLSGIDSVMGAHLEYLISILPLADNIKTAILEHNNDIGNALETVLNFEHGEWDHLASIDNPYQLNHCYLEAIQWCDQISAELYNGG